MKIEDLKEIYNRITRNSFYFWFYSFFSIILVLYLFTLKFRIDIFGVPPTYVFVFLNFSSFNLYFNLGWILGVSIMIYLFISGIISSIIIYKKISNNTNYNLGLSRTHLIHSFLTISVIWIIIYQISWFMLYKETKKEIEYDLNK